MLSISILIAVVVFSFLMLRYSTAAMISATYILVVILSRLVSTAYIDVAGPVYAVELNREIGGLDSSMPIITAFVILFMATLWFVFRRSKIKKLLRQKYYTFSSYQEFMLKGMLVFYTVYVVAIYADLLMRGNIPLFNQLERYEYGAIAGSLYHITIFHGFLLAAGIGFGFVYPRLHGRQFDFRFLFILLLFFIYFVLTGHRFAVFFGYVSFFLLVFSPFLMMKQAGVLPSIHTGESILSQLIKSKYSISVLGLVFVMVISAVLFNSMVNVRAYDFPLEMLIQRVLIQPAELWWDSWNRIFHQGEFTPNLAWHFMFDEPFDAERNTGIQYLMIKSLGIEEAERILIQGAQYAGGYPEILIELLGWGAVPFAFMFAIVTALLIRKVNLFVYQGQILSAILCVYVYYGFTLLYIGGMLNFLTVIIFWLKVLALILVSITEAQICRKASKSSESIISNV